MPRFELVAPGDGVMLPVDGKPRPFTVSERGTAKSFGLMFSRGNFLRIFTVVFCVFALVVLAFGGKLSEGAVAVLSGIAGFVLGGVSKDGAAPSNPENGNS